MYDPKKIQSIKKARNLQVNHNSLTNIPHAGIMNFKQAEKILHDIIENNPLSIQIVDKKGFTEQVNAAHTVLFKAEPKDDFCIFTDIQLKEQGLSEYFERLRKGEVVYFPDNRYNAHKQNPEFPDEEVWVKAIGFPVFDTNNEIELYIIVHENITEQKRKENELRDLNEQLYQLTKFNQQIREEERKSLARELHDAFGQSLLAVKLELGNIRNKISDTGIVEEMNHVIANVNETTDTIKRIIMGLRPVIIEEIGIDAAIKLYCTDFAKRHHIEVFHDIEPITDLSQDTSLGLFRILQEALTNVYLHSEADKADIWLNKNEGELEFIISDNGKGISEDQITSNKSFGIISMRERAKEIGGEFKIKRGSDFGTIIEIRIPLSKN
jgi:two-component system, NarL family, sensor histidine kinase UhpB